MIHFWELPENRSYILLNSNFKESISGLLKNNKTESKLLMEKLKRNKIRIKTIKEISKKLKIDINDFEKEIIWIGGINSKGLSNPKIPFNLSNREGSRFIAAIINDGCLTKKGEGGYGRLMYDNFDKTLRNSVINDYLYVFGGKNNEIAFRNYEKKKFLEFSSIIRDIMFLVLKKRGSKAESNIELPSLIFQDRENMFGWIEQTVADEGEVKYELSKYRRAIIWRRSLDVTHLFDKPIEKEIPFKRLSSQIQERLYKQKCNLIEDEKKMLNKLGIDYNEYNLGVYPTNKGKVRTRWQISITKRENLIKLRKFIKIPSKIKEEKFSRICKGFQRYKEPLKVRNSVIELGKNNNSFISTDLKLKMKYKNVNNANSWLRRFEKENLIKKIKKAEYGDGDYRRPAEYKLNF